MSTAPIFDPKATTVPVLRYVVALADYLHFGRAAAAAHVSQPTLSSLIKQWAAIMAGPYCTLMLADMGADVVKIEAFPEGDGSRRFDPKVNGESYCFAVLNRNKKSVGLNMKDARGKEIFLQLARDADIIMENYRPGVTRKLGIDFESIRKINPDIIYCSVSGFGQTGPYSQKGGFDIIAQGMSGIMTMTGEPGESAGFTRRQRYPPTVPPETPCGRARPVRQRCRGPERPRDRL